MVQTDISQLLQDCNQWIVQLLSYRDELNQLNTQLQEDVKKSLSREDLTELEHFQNQFQIQLINVHDVKKQARLLSQRLDYYRNNPGAPDDLENEFDKLADDFQTLEQTLAELRNEFSKYEAHL